MTFNKGLSKKSGFTLLELIISLVILGILVATAIPVLGAHLERNKFKGIVSETHSMVTFGRSLATLRGTHITLCPLDDDKQCSNQWHEELTLFEDLDQSASLNGSETILRISDAIIDNQTVQGGLKTERDFSRSSPILFRPGGDAFGHNGTLTLCQTGNIELSATIIISAPGRIRQGEDKDKDGLVEDSSGNNISCS